MMEKTKNRALVLGLSLALSALVLTASSRTSADGSGDDILVVANASVKANGIERSALRSYFLKEIKSWPSGDKVTVVNAAAGSELRKRFQDEVLGMSSDEEKTYWEQQRIRYGADAPPEFANNLKAVFKIKGSLSYVFRRDYVEGVAKVLLVIPAKSTQPGKKR